jgi:hypothetical protein
MTPEELLVRFHEQVPDRKAFISILTGGRQKFPVAQPLSLPKDKNEKKVQKT